MHPDIHRFSESFPYGVEAIGLKAEASWQHDPAYLLRSAIANVRAGNKKLATDQITEVIQILHEQQVGNGAD